MYLLDATPDVEAKVIEATLLDRGVDQKNHPVCACLHT